MKVRSLVIGALLTVLLGASAESVSAQTSGDPTTSTSATTISPTSSSTTTTTTTVPTSNPADSEYVRLLKNTGATALWRLNEASGTVAKDSIGSLAGTIASVNPSGGSGLGVPGALRAESDTAVQGFGPAVLTVTNLGPVSGRSVEFWFKTAAPNTQLLNWDRFGLRLGASGLLEARSATGWVGLSGFNRQLADGQWHLVGMKEIGDFALVYVDAAIADSDSALALSTTGVTTLSVGVGAVTVDEVAVFTEGYPLGLNARSHLNLANDCDPAALTDNYGQLLERSGSTSFFRFASGLLAEDDLGCVLNVVSPSATGGPGILGSTGLVVGSDWALTFPNDRRTNVYAWFRSATGSQSLAQVGSASIRLDPGGRVTLDASATVFNGIDRNFADNRWHLLDVTNYGTNVVVRVDLLEIGQFPLPSDNPTLRIGGTAGLGIDEVSYSDGYNIAQASDLLVDALGASRTPTNFQTPYRTFISPDQPLRLFSFEDPTNPLYADSIFFTRWPKMLGQRMRLALKAAGSGHLRPIGRRSTLLHRRLIFGSRPTEYRTGI
jgi:hypothetical protein